MCPDDNAKAEEAINKDNVLGDMTIPKDYIPPELEKWRVTIEKTCSTIAKVSTAVLVIWGLITYVVLPHYVVANVVAFLLATISMCYLSVTILLTFRNCNFPVSPHRHVFSAIGFGLIGSFVIFAYAMCRYAFWTTLDLLQQSGLDVIPDEVEYLRFLLLCSTASVFVAGLTIIAWLIILSVILRNLETAWWLFEDEVIDRYLIKAVLGDINVPKELAERKRFQDWKQQIQPLVEQHGRKIIEIGLRKVLRLRE